MSDPERFAPGWPGIPPRWTSSAKTGVGTALNQHSRVWFTLSHGILNEIYYPRVDQACTRDLGLMVTNGKDFFSEEKRHCTFLNRVCEPGTPLYELTTPTCRAGIGSKKKYSPIHIATWCCKKSALCLCKEPSRIITCTRCSPPTSPTAAITIQDGLAITRAIPMLFAEHDGVSLAFGMFGAVAKNVSGLRGILRWMAGSFQQLSNDVGLHPR